MNDKCVFKGFILIVSFLMVSTFGWAMDPPQEDLSLDRKSWAFFKTQTGSHLRYMFPDIHSPDALVRKAIDYNIENYPIPGFDGPNGQLEKNKMFNKLVPFIEREISKHQTHIVFYTGYDNEITMYDSILKEFMELCALTDLEKNHPLRLKNPNTVKTVPMFLRSYLKSYIEEATQKGIPPYDPSRNSGFSFAPDRTQHARNHSICVNVSLFGNLETERENSIFYFFKSFSNSKPNDALINDLFQSTGLGRVNNSNRQAQIQRYKDLFRQTLKDAGGGLRQIFVSKEVVDLVCFPCHAKGVPWYERDADPKIFATGTFSDGSSSNKKCIPVLDDAPEGLQRPMITSMMELYVKNADEFAKKYSYKRVGGKYSMDRAQARLVVDPKRCMNKMQMEVYETFRFDIRPEILDFYKTNLKQFVLEDVKHAICYNKFSNQFYEYGFGMGQLIQVTFQRIKLDPMVIMSIKDIIIQADKRILRNVLNMLQESFQNTAAQQKNRVQQHWNNFTILADVQRMWNNPYDCGAQTVDHLYELMDRRLSDLQ